MEDIKPVIAKNLTDLRKSMNWTQAELAQKLNYSDKAVSKWERGESIPDIIVLKEIADLFNVTVDYLIKPEHQKTEEAGMFSKLKKRNRLIIALMSASFVFLIATIAFVIFGLCSIPFSKYSWLIYIYTLPAAFTVLLVFNSIWGRRKINFALISALVWSVLLAIYLSFLSQNIWLVFIIGIPAQIIILLWSNYRRRHNL